MSSIDDVHKALQPFLSNIESEFSLLKKEHKLLQQTNSDLKQRCDVLEQTNSTILQRQSQGEAEIIQLKQEVKSLRTSLKEAERKAKYLEVVHKNENWKYPLHVPQCISEFLPLGFTGDESAQIRSDIYYIADITKKMRMGENIDYVDPIVAGSGGNPQYYMDTCLTIKSLQMH